MANIKIIWNKIITFAPIAILLKIVGVFLTRWLIPTLLLILIVLPLILTFARNQKKEESFQPAEKIQFGTLVKSIKNTATVEFEYSYNVKNWQTAKLEKILVKEGETVQENQELAKISFINSPKTRDTDTINQIRSAEQDLENLERSRLDVMNINEATNDQSNVQLGGKQIEEKLATQKFLDKDRENRERRERLTRERDNLQKMYDELRLSGNTFDSLSQYKTELKAKQDQYNNLTVGTATTSLQNQINQQNSTISSVRSQINSGICDDSIRPVGSTLAPYNEVSCDSAYNQLNLAYDTIDNLESQLSRQSNVDYTLSSRLLTEINDLQNKINTIKNSEAYKNFKNPSLPLADSQITANTQKMLSDIQQDITSRKNDLKALDDTNNLTPLEDQLKTAARARNQLEYDKKVQNENLNKTISDLDQRINSVKTNLENLRKKLSDVQEDIDEQTNSKTLKAKNGGLVGKINFEEGIEITAASNVFDIVSQNKILKADVSADAKTNLKQGLSAKIINPEYSTWENLKLSKIDISPLPKTAQNTDTQYQIEVNIPKEKQSELVTGKTLDLEIILEKRENVFFVGRTAILEEKTYIDTEGNVKNYEKPKNKAYVGIGEIKKDKEKPKYKELIEKEVKIGLDTGRYIQIVEGLNEDDLVFPIFPKSEIDRKKLQEQFLSKN
jgi:multidrug efflux pump subunit AcrA (membrane-fusion protein)